MLNGSKVYLSARGEKHFLYTLLKRHFLVQFKKTMPEKVIIKVFGCHTLKHVHPFFQTSVIPVDVLNMENSFL
jgi:ribosome biogenesis protein Nip4